MVTSSGSAANLAYCGFTHVIYSRRIFYTEFVLCSNPCDPRRTSIQSIECPRRRLYISMSTDSFHHHQSMVLDWVRSSHGAHREPITVLVENLSRGAHCLYSSLNFLMALCTSLP